MIHWPQLFGPMLFLYILYKWPYEIKVSWKHIKIWIRIEVLSLLIRGLVFGFFPELIPKGMLFATKVISISQFLGVYWEDTFYILPIVLLSKYIQPKFIIYTFMLFCAYRFGIEHIYQGVLVATMMGGYVIFSFLYRRTVGIGTVMICHVMHDVSMATQMTTLIIF